MKYKEELQEAVNFICSDYCQNYNVASCEICNCQGPGCKYKILIQNHINSLPDNYEPVLNEMKLSELLKRLNNEKSSSQYEYIKHFHFEYMGVKQVSSYAISRLPSESHAIIMVIKDNKILDIYNHSFMYGKWLYRLWLNETKIIDDLEGE